MQSQVSTKVPTVIKRLSGVLRNPTFVLFAIANHPQLVLVKPFHSWKGFLFDHFEKIDHAYPIVHNYFFNVSESF